MRSTESRLRILESYAERASVGLHTLQVELKATQQQLSDMDAQLSKAFDTNRFLAKQVERLITEKEIVMRALATSLAVQRLQAK